MLYPFVIAHQIRISLFQFNTAQLNNLQQILIKVHILSLVSLIAFISRPIRAIVVGDGIDYSLEQIFYTKGKPISSVQTIFRPQRKLQL